MSKSPEDFIFLASHLADLGYDTVNLNLGCPFPMVARKGRGSGMLPYPEKIEAFLASAIPAMPNALSVKVRLGRKNADDIFRLIPVFNQYPITEIIIHPRTGIQMYGGNIDLDRFEKCLALSRHPVVYNGDIDTPDTFRSLSRRFSTVSRWMIGRWAVANPFLPAIIKNGEDRFENKVETMRQFHDTLYDGYRQRFSGPGHLAERMKGFWKYFALCFKDSRRIQKKIFRARSAAHYETLVARFFESEATWAGLPAPCGEQDT